MKRLHDESPNSALRDLISAGRAELPCKRDLMLLETSVIAAIAGGAVLGSGSTVAAASASGGLVSKMAGLSLAWKALAVAIVVGIGGATSVVVVRGDQAQPNERVVRRQPDPTEHQGTPGPVTRVPQYPIAPPPEESDSATSAPTTTIVARSPLSNIDPSVRSDRPHRNHADPNDALGEADLLSAAQDSSQRSPGKALSLLREHRRRFPGGVLEQERDFLEIEVLLEMGRIDQARERASLFEEQFPGSAHLRRLQTLVPRVSQIPGD